MSNMSYCKFENTDNDLQECLDALRERNISSNSEKRAANRILQTVLLFLEDEGIIENYNAGKIKKIIEECEKQEDE